ASIAIICIFAGYLPLNCIFIAVACSQLENLAFELRSLKQNYEIEEQLRNWILYHQKTLRFVKAIEDMLSTYIGVQMIPLYLGPCLSVFSAITSWNDFTDQTQAFVAVSVFFCQASLLCWFGTQLTESVSIPLTTVFVFSLKCGMMFRDIEGKRRLVGLVSARLRGVGMPYLANVKFLYFMFLFLKYY
ncbi:hypothetical protein C0J52_28088, partial [Blattella germanica]